MCMSFGISRHIRLFCAIMQGGLVILVQLGVICGDVVEVCGGLWVAELGPSTYQALDSSAFSSAVHVWVEGMEPSPSHPWVVRQSGLLDTAGMLRN